MPFREKKPPHDPGQAALRKKNHHTILRGLRRPELGPYWTWSSLGDIPVPNPYGIKLNGRLQPALRKINTLPGQAGRSREK